MSGALVVALTGGSPLAASVSPSDLVGVRIGVGTVFTGESATVTAQGGSPPYTYLWTFVSGDSSIYPQLVTSASSRFYVYFTAPGSLSAVYKCVVTDSTATSVDTGNVNISLTSA